MSHLEKGRVVIFGCGTGNPFVTTDTAAALRANEIKADVFLKATNVDGHLYRRPPQGSQCEALPHDQLHCALKDELKVADATAFSMCMENGMPILVFDSHARAILSEPARARILGPS